jgi:hypothetical protein
MYFPSPRFVLPKMKAHLWHTAFKPATGGAPQNATTRMLLLVTKLHKNGVLSAEAKGRVKVFTYHSPTHTHTHVRAAGV